MPQITTADVTYAAIDSGRASPSLPTPTRTMTIQFGDGSLLYTNTGIPLDSKKLGCPAALQIIMLDTGNTIGYVPKWNATTNRIRLFQNDTAATLGPLIELTTAAAVTSTTLRVLVTGY